jgi:hypothetical protein
VSERPALRNRSGRSLAEAREEDRAERHWRAWKARTAEALVAEPLPFLLLALPIAFCVVLWEAIFGEE